MKRIFLTEAAVRDIEELDRYGATEFGSAKADEYMNGLRESLRRLRDYPGLGIARDDLRPETRSLRYRSHRIYYRPEPRGILIQRVLHYARMVRRDMID